MTTNDPRREAPNTYVVQDRSNLEEMARLQIQDQMITTLMGGVLPEQPDPARFRRVLDVGCGTGGWLIETAKTYPTIETLIGVDASGKMLDYAREQAISQQVADHVEFHTMDALLILAFPSRYFDLVNHRFAIGWLRTWEWPKLLSEYQRVSKRGGVIRITEGTISTEVSSPALLRLNQLALEAMYQSGHYFTPEEDGVIGHLADLMRRCGVQDVRTRSYILEYRAGTPEGQQLAEDMRLAYRTLVPFIRKWTHLPDDYEEIYQRMLVEIQQPDFVAKSRMLTAWGKNAPE